MVSYIGCISKKEVIILMEHEICPFRFKCKNSNLHTLERCWGTRKERKDKFVCEMKEL
jgi:hypothetical protein